MAVFLPNGKMCLLRQNSRSRKVMFSVVRQFVIRGYIFCTTLNVAAERKSHLNEEVSAVNMKRISQWILVPLLAIAVVPWLADLSMFFGSRQGGVAYAKGGGGGGGGGNGGGNGKGGDHDGKGSSDSARGSDQGQGARGGGVAGRGGRVGSAASTAGSRSKSGGSASASGKRVSGKKPANTSLTATTRTSPAATQSPKNMGEAVSTAAHTAKAQAKDDGAKVGPAVSAAVHEAQDIARDRDANDSNSRTSTTTGGRGTPVGPRLGTRTSTRTSARP